MGKLKRKYEVKKETQLLFNFSRDCFITGKFPECDCTMLIHDNLHVGSEGLELLSNYFSKIDVGGVKVLEKAKVFLIPNHICDICDEEDLCLTFFDLRNNFNLDFHICKECIDCCGERLKKGNDYVVHNTSEFKVLNTPKVPYYDNLEQDFFESRDILMVGNRGFTTNLSNIKKIINAVENPDDYDFSEKTSENNSCISCDLSKDKGVLLVDDFICDSCREKIIKSLQTYIEDNIEKIISSSI